VGGAIAVVVKAVIADQGAAAVHGVEAALLQVTSPPARKPVARVP
jgi:hypothetical protein